MSRDRITNRKRSKHTIIVAAGALIVATAALAVAATSAAIPAAGAARASAAGPAKKLARERPGPQQVPPTSQQPTLFPARQAAELMMYRAQQSADAARKAASEQASARAAARAAQQRAAARAAHIAAVRAAREAAARAAAREAAARAAHIAAVRAAREAAARAAHTAAVRAARERAEAPLTAGRATAGRAAGHQAVQQRAGGEMAREADIIPAAAGSSQAIAQSMLGSYGWSSSQFSCLNSLWTGESGWQVTASNPSTGAYGIPQALPPVKMASAGPDWQTDPATQIRWGLEYIKSLYGFPCAAWSHERSAGWY